MSTGCPPCGERMEPIPMNRYKHPIPTGCPDRPGPCRMEQEGLDHVLTALACQNQILTDLLCAVNGLTAAILWERKEFQGRR